MAYAFCLPDFLHQRIAKADGGRNGRLLGHEVRNLDMTAEAHHLVADGMLETRYHRHGDNHHCQSDGNTNSGNCDSRTADLLSVSALTIYLPCYEKW